MYINEILVYLLYKEDVRIEFYIRLNMKRSCNIVKYVD